MQSARLLSSEEGVSGVTPTNRRHKVRVDTSLLPDYSAMVSAPSQMPLGKSSGAFEKVPRAFGESHKDAYATIKLKHHRGSRYSYCG